MPRRPQFLARRRYRRSAHACELEDDAEEEEEEKEGKEGGAGGEGRLREWLRTLAKPLARTATPPPLRTRLRRNADNEVPDRQGDENGEKKPNSDDDASTYFLVVEGQARPSRASPRR